MNKVVVTSFALVVGLFLNGCKYTKHESRNVTDQDTVISYSISDSSALGDSVMYIYEGVLPAADVPGIKYVLKVFSRRHSGDGTFILEQTYLGTGETDNTFTTTGKRYTLRGDAKDVNATVWQMVSDDGNEILNFLYENDSTLVLLNKDLERSDSGLNYSLRLIK
ncbi:copper resistance protein NlpE N-terminal domain-containing protein [Coprobacter sp.]